MKLQHTHTHTHTHSDTHELARANTHTHTPARERARAHTHTHTHTHTVGIHAKLVCKPSHVTSALWLRQVAAHSIHYQVLLFVFAFHSTSLHNTFSSHNPAAELTACVTHVNLCICKYNQVPERTAWSRSSDDDRLELSQRRKRQPYSPVHRKSSIR